MSVGPPLMTKLMMFLSASAVCSANKQMSATRSIKIMN